MDRPVPYTPSFPRLPRYTHENSIEDAAAAAAANEPVVAPQDTGAPSEFPIARDMLSRPYVRGMWRRVGAAAFVADDDTDWALFFTLYDGKSKKQTASIAEIVRFVRNPRIIAWCGIDLQQRIQAAMVGTEDSLNSVDNRFSDYLMFYALSAQGSKDDNVIASIISANIPPVDGFGWVVERLRDGGQQAIDELQTALKLYPGYVSLMFAPEVRFAVVPDGRMWVTMYTPHVLVDVKQLIDFINPNWPLADRIWSSIVFVAFDTLAKMKWTVPRYSLQDLALERNDIHMLAHYFVVRQFTDEIIRANFTTTGQ